MHFNIWVQENKTKIIKTITKNNMEQQSPSPQLMGLGLYTSII